MDINSSQNNHLENAFDAQVQAVPSDLDALHIAELAGLGTSRSNSPSGGGQQHPNIFVRGLPLSWSETEITAVFQQYGQLSSMRLVRHSVTKQSLGLVTFPMLSFCSEYVNIFWRTCIHLGTVDGCVSSYSSALQSNPNLLAVPHNLIISIHT